MSFHSCHVGKDFKNQTMQLEEKETHTLYVRSAWTAAPCENPSKLRPQLIVKTESLRQCRNHTDNFK